MNCSLCNENYDMESLTGIYKDINNYYSICNRCREVYPKIDRLILDYLAFTSMASNTFCNLGSQMLYIKQGNELSRIKEK